MGTITKNQHYVPQFLLRNFAAQQKRIYRINVLDIERDNFRPNQNVADICSQNYFYDRNNAIERFLEKNVETPAAAEIERLCSECPTVATTPSRELIRFVSVQLARTAEALDQALIFINGITKTMFRELARLNNFDEDAAERCRLVPTEPRMLASRLALNGCISWLLIHDLEQHLIINRTVRDFVISDHPVVHSNGYLFGQKFINTGSLAVAGSQIFLPISPERLLCLYDPHVYKYGQKNTHVSYVDSIETINAINALQVRNGALALMFRESEHQKLAARQCHAWRSRPLWEHRSFYNPAQEDDQGELRSQHVVSKMQTPPKVDLPFFKVKKNMRRRQVVNDDRVPEAVAAVDTMMKQFKE